MTDAQLSELFAAAGEVTSATVIIDKFSGKSKGFGFVEMATVEAAENAVNTMNGKEVEGRALKVSEARPPKPRTNDNNFNRNRY